MNAQPCCNRCGACATDCRCAGACGDATTLAPTAQRAGLATLAVRLGTHGQFLAQSLRSLSSRETPALQQLGIRLPSDPAIAWLDAWSVAADVLTFYRERITNEGFLRTATEEFSLRELARQVGYKPRPGIAASVRLAYSLDPTAAPVVIPAGAKAQTVPQPGEQMQTFETSESLEARAEWSEMPPRATRIPALDAVTVLLRPTLRLAGTTLSVRPGERLLFVYGPGLGQQVVREVAGVRPDLAHGFVELSLKPRSGLTRPGAELLLKTVKALSARILVAVPDPKEVSAAHAVASYLLGGSAADALEALLRNEPDFKELRAQFTEILGARVDMRQRIEPRSIDDVMRVLDVAPAAQLRSSRLLARGVADGLGGAGPKRASLLSTASRDMARNLYAAWERLPAVAADRATAPEVLLLRTTAGAYGAAAPKLVRRGRTRFELEELPLEAQDRKFAFLDVLVDGVAADSYALVESPRDLDLSSRTIRFARVRHAQPAARGDYGISGKVTRLELADPVTGTPLALAPADALLSFLRNTTYGVASEPVTLAAEPTGEEVAGATVRLDRLYQGLDSGRWIIVAGERTDIVANGTRLTGIRDGELAMIASVSQEGDPASPGDTPRTVLSLAQPLAYRYLPDATTVYGNVVQATHGETVKEVIGSGDATVPFARFALRRGPLTFVSAPTTSGVQGSQDLRANGTKLREVESLLDAGAGERVYELSVDAAGAVAATFGDGVYGARVPSGQENVRAVYRVGIGSPGNVQAAQISLLTSRPLGVKGVINPLPASGGADRDGPESIRANAPLAALVLSPLSRLVSISDYEYFARRFAGIGDAFATRLSDGAYECIHVTLAGTDNIPLSADDALVTSLATAFADFGNPALPVVIAVRELIALFVQARVVLQADADEDTVVPEIRRRVLHAFSPARRRLAQPAYLSEVTTAIQQAPGVDWVDVEVFGGISELQLRNPATMAAAVEDLRQQAGGGPTATMVRCGAAMAAAGAPPERLQAAPAGRQPRLLPAQLAFLLPNVPDTLVLNIG